MVAVEERDAKSKALEAEQKARDNAMTALRDMTDDVIENQLARGTTLTDENKDFLRKMITHYEGLGAITADHAAAHPHFVCTECGSIECLPDLEYVVTRTELTPTDYALAWALTHYLALKRGDDFVKFLVEMGKTPPLEARTADDHVAAFKKAFWEAEVTKMINVYGAPIDKADVPKIVDYLVQVY